MDEFIAYCGLNCNSCPIHLATMEQDNYKQHSMRISIAKECYEHYGMKLTPEEVNDCDGCRANAGRLFSGCMNCMIRECVISKNLNTCASCDEFACDKLEAMFKLDPEAKNRLQEIRNG